MRILTNNSYIIKKFSKTLLKNKKHLLVVSSKFGALTCSPFKNNNKFITEIKARSLSDDDFKTIVKTVGERIAREGLDGNSIINDGPMNGGRLEIALRCYDCDNCAFLSVGYHNNNDIGIDTISCVGETISQTTLQRVLFSTALPQATLIEMISICPVGELTNKIYNFCLNDK